MMLFRFRRLLKYYPWVIGFFVMTCTCDSYAMTSQKPLELLISQYKQNRILAFGESNHAKYQSLEYLIELLRVPEVGFDPELTVIATEFSHDVTEFLEHNSMSLFIDQQDVPFYFRENKHGAYYWKVFFPFLRDLNLKREEKGLDPILVKGIDGYPSDDFPKKIEKVTGALQCELFWNRENSTAQHFKNIAHPFFDHVKGKIIVFYHIAHLAFLPTEEQRKISYQSTEPGWKLEELERTPGNWLSMVFQDHPEWRAQTSIVLLDESYRLLDVECLDEPITKIVVDLIERESITEAFGISLRESEDDLSSSEKEILNQKGKAAFNLVDQDRRYIAKVIAHFESQISLAEMIDAIIWTPDTTAKDLRVFD